MSLYGASLQTKTKDQIDLLNLKKAEFEELLSEIEKNN